MNDRLQALLAAERAVAANSDDDAFANRVVGRLRDAAVVGAGVALATAATPASATTAVTTTTTTTTLLGGLGVAKAVAMIGVAATIAVSAVVVAIPRAPMTKAVTASAPVVAVAHVDDVDDVVVDVVAPVVVEAPAAVVVAVPPRRRAVPVSAAPSPAPTVVPPSPPSELERYDLASAALRAGRVDEAATLFAAVLAAHPRGMLRPETQVSLLESLYRARRFADVVAAVPAALVDVDASRHAGVRRLEGDALVQLGRCDEARAAYDAAHAQITSDDVTAALAACAAR